MTNSSIQMDTDQISWSIEEGEIESREKGSLTWLEWLLPINKNPWRKNYPHHYSWVDLTCHITCVGVYSVYILPVLKSTKIFIIFLTDPTTQSHSSSLTRPERKVHSSEGKKHFLYILHMFYLFMYCNEGGGVCEFE